jgi:flagellar assembly factor FliW
MKFTLPRFGVDEVEIDPKTLIEFPNGMPGFENCKHFKLFHSGDSPVIFWLQSIDDSSVVLSVTDPETLRVSYEITLTDEDLSTLQFKTDDELQIAVILAQQENYITEQNEIVANYTSPIVINVSKQIAMQKTLQSSEISFHAHQPLFEAPQISIPSAHYFPEVSRTRSVANDSLCALAL